MKLEDLKNKEFEITSEGLLKVVEKKSKFVPKDGELYWYVGLYGKTINTIYDRGTDSWFINHHPVFRTDEEAKEYKLYLEILDKYKYEFTDEEWKDENIKKWFLCYFTDSDKLSECDTYMVKHPNCTFFKSKEDAKAFVEEAGEENVKKFMFDVWE